MKNFQKRFAKAERIIGEYIREDWHSHECFKNYDDSDAMALALLRRADNDPQFATALCAWYGGNARLKDIWPTTREKYAHIATRDIPALAERLRRLNRERSEEGIQRAYGIEQMELIPA